MERLRQEQAFYRIAGDVNQTTAAATQRMHGGTCAPTIQLVNAYDATAARAQNDGTRRAIRLTVPSVFSLFSDAWTRGFPTLAPNLFILLLPNRSLPTGYACLWREQRA